MEYSGASWFLRQQRYVQAIVCLPVVLAEMMAFLLVATRTIPEVRESLHAFALALLLLPAYCLWRTPEIKPSLVRNAILVWVGVIVGSAGAGVALHSPVLLWIAAIALALPLIAAFTRGELRWQ